MFGVRWSGGDEVSCQLADLLTKALTHDDHMKHTDLILKGISQSIAPKPSGRGGVRGSDNPPEGS